VTSPGGFHAQVGGCVGEWVSVGVIEGVWEGVKVGVPEGVAVSVGLATNIEVDGIVGVLLNPTTRYDIYGVMVLGVRIITGLTVIASTCTLPEQPEVSKKITETKINNKYLEILKYLHIRLDKPAWIGCSVWEFATSGVELSIGYEICETPSTQYLSMLYNKWINFNNENIATHYWI